MTTKHLIEDYERRNKSANAILQSTKKDGIDAELFIRLTTKIGCYRTFISELKKLEEVVDNTSY